MTADLHHNFAFCFNIINTDQQVIVCLCKGCDLHQHVTVSGLQPDRRSI